MLTSSDAKSRCMWYMLVWSILMTLVSQFLDIRHHVAFFLFAGLGVLILPVLTAIYSNTSGRHGAGLIRVGFVFLDPVFSCITITPVLSLNHLPAVLDRYHCLLNHDQSNDTLQCLENKTTDVHATVEAVKNGYQTTESRMGLLNKQQMSFLIIQASIVVPILLALVMGRRTRKMNRKTYMLNFTYWFVVAIEAADLLETALVSKDYKHAIFTTEAIVSIVMIVTNSYAVVTLISYLTPLNEDGLLDKKYSKKFDMVYKLFVGCAGVFFVEIPLLVARFQIILTDTQKLLHGSFYMWVLKDTLFIMLISAMLLLQFNVKSRLFSNSCAPRFDNTDIFFEPEKRDRYISYQKQRRVPSPVLTQKMIRERSNTPSPISFVHTPSPTSLSSSAFDDEDSEPDTPVPPPVGMDTKKPPDPTSTDCTPETSSSSKKKKKVTFNLDVGLGHSTPRTVLFEEEGLYPMSPV